MEYRKRNRSRARRRSSAQPTPSGAGRVITALLIIGAIVYIVSASAAGTWIAKNIIAPVFDMLSSGGSTPTDALDAHTAPSPDGDVTVLLDDDNAKPASASSEELSLPALNCYALQMGAFGEITNAQSEAAALKLKGAGGYIMQDGERYRVFASAYLDEASAKEVRERLTGEGVDCTVYAMCYPMQKFRVTAPQDKLDAIALGFSAISKAHESLSQAVLDFDRSAKSAKEGVEAALVIRQTLQGDMNDLSALGRGEPVLGDIIACYEAIDARLNELCSGSEQSIVDFSAQMKYTQLYTSHEYAKLLNSLG